MASVTVGYPQMLRDQVYSSSFILYLPANLPPQLPQYLARVTTAIMATTILSTFQHYIHTIIVMVGSLFSYLTFRQLSTPQSQSKPGVQPVRALPANWYTSEAMYQLERRSIFRRRWLLMTHQSRLKTGDHLHYDVANFDVYITRDSAGEILASHKLINDDRNDSGAEDDSPVIGSSSDSIHTRLDRNGFIWINMDPAPVPEVAWEDRFDHVDEQARFDQFNFDDYVFDHTWNLVGPFNWKILADNFNECYHCATTHPDLTTGLIDLESYDVACDPAGDHIQHKPNTPEDRKALGQEICSTYCFPNVSFTVTQHFLFIQKFMPKSPGESIMYYEVWKNRKSAEEDFLLISDTYKRVMGEDKVLCERAQKNIEAGTFVAGELHPQKEKGPIFFQKRDKEIVLEYAARERKLGRKLV
jgi:phenylpropionate dioxygenase-like ring-hydroxylating dioxygenase large terminal subunit